MSKSKLSVTRGKPGERLTKQRPCKPKFRLPRIEEVILGGWKTQTVETIVVGNSLVIKIICGAGN
jgi:hypothetical protein